MNLVSHLQDSSWTLELEHALERFSISTYLNWLDQHHIIDGWYMDVEFPERFLTYLEGKVSNPCGQTKYLLQLLLSIRENLAFITIIACITWNMLHLPSTVPPLERNFAS